MKTKEEECLVTKAKRECMCDWCKEMRKLEEMSLKAMVNWEAYKVWRDCLEEKN